jgi:hypothetical protein
LRVRTNSAPINSKKSTTELNGLHCTEFERLEFNSRFIISTTLSVF